MNIIELLLISLSLSMDAFTISICKGLRNTNSKTGLVISFSFGLFQFIMPILGFYLGNIISNRLISYQSYLSSIILITIGILMIKEDKITELDYKLKFSELIFLSIATSIDAFVIGISFSFIKINIIYSSIIIGIITFILCLVGYFLGYLFHNKTHQSNIIGGITLIILGIKALF